MCCLKKLYVACMQVKVGLSCKLSIVKTFSCSAHNFVLHMMWFESNLALIILMIRQNVKCKNNVPGLKGQVQSPQINFVHRLHENLLYPAHGFVMHCGLKVIW